ncbi:TniQ family protein [Paenibacillus athensensis]|uniref:TniQ family protein n=1 Tax=Paenibacillus athensensis TaxID=1967502 RepID=UPI00143005E2|nr:TniQ family protein [Paenibacillus athensensis]MCD1257650.1 TniQ family protein [Paenibacillus athensensis]
MNTLHSNHGVSKHFAWNSNWIQEFESFWSIVEKFKFANSASSWDFVQLFGKHDTKKLAFTKLHRDLYEVTVVDEDKIQAEMQINMDQINLSSIHTLFGTLGEPQRAMKPKSINRHFLRSYLCYCPQCLQNGYHSILHQIKLITICPFHCTPLITACPSCQEPIPYELLVKKSAGPYYCKCDHILVSWDPASFTAQWKNHHSKIVNNLVLDCLHLNLSQRNRLENVVFCDLVDLDQLDDGIQLFLKVSDPKYPYDQLGKATHPCPKPTNLMRREQYDDAKEWSPITGVFQLTSRYSGLETKAITKELGKSAQNIIHSIENHLRKTLLKDHKTCIHRLVRVTKEENESLPPICPYAFAFAFWKMSMYKIPHYYDVDNPTYKMGDLQLLEFGEEQDGSFLRNIVDLLLKKYPIFHPRKFHHLRWVLNHIIARLAYAHFKNWLHVANECAPKQELPKKYNLLYKPEDFFIMHFPYNRAEDMEIYWPIPDNNGLRMDLQCPYTTIRSRRKKGTETSFRPLLVAINE